MMDNIKKIFIVGYGEIGSSLEQLYKDFNEYEIFIFDPSLNKKNGVYGADIMHICIPYSNDFVSIVNDYVVQYFPKITVINSTVAPGTTAQILGNVCHSPNRGLHPNLKDGMLTFLKYIGSENPNTSELVKEHFYSLGIESYICKNSITSEYAKLLDTSYYGVCIAFHSDVMKICEEKNLDFDEVMTIYNKSYNEGYSKLGRPEFSRPVLYPTNKIGGHCIVPNANILLSSSEIPSVSNILRYS
jgi:UDP-N-acetyl-D-mannosaminuronate dehydrogenase